jgi:hypothetical protein
MGLIIYCLPRFGTCSRLAAGFRCRTAADHAMAQHLPLESATYSAAGPVCGLLSGEGFTVACDLRVGVRINTHSHRETVDSVG